MSRRSVRALRSLALALLATLLAAPLAGPLLGAASATTLDPPAGSVDRAHARASVPDYCTRTVGVELDRIGVRFAPETGARVRNGRLVSLGSSGQDADLRAVQDVVSSIPGAVLAPRFDLGEAALDDLRARGEARTLGRLPDLNLFALVILPPAPSESEAQTRLADLLAQLNSAPGVVEAWGLAQGEVASIPATDRTTAASSFAPAQSSGRGTGASTTPAEHADTVGNLFSRDAGAGTTPDFSNLQGYLYAPPVGFWADSVWAFPGGLGQGVQIIGMEWGWQWDHEDLPAPFYTYNDQGPSDHGTATLGIFGGRHNGYGVSGIAGEAELGSIHLGDIAADILRTATVLGPGGVYTMSIQVGGPLGWMPTEWWPDCFAAVQTVSALGITGCQAAGNSALDLDDPLYDGAFDRRVRDSGGLIIGAGTPNGLDAEGFSNYGSRVSLQGWGSSVVTTCCGDLYGSDPTTYYTAGFNGTSSATPCIAGCVASLQGQAIATFGEAITPPLVEEILRASGTPQNGARLIGPRPNLVAARERLLRGFGDVVVTVRDGDTQELLADWIVEIAETGRIAKTGPDGQAALQLSAGDLTFHVPATFYYASTDVPYSVEHEGDHAVTLEVFRIPTGDLSGTVRDAHGSPIADAKVELHDSPVAAVFTDGAGQYVLEDLPENPAYTLFVSDVPTKGAAAKTLEVTSGNTTTWNPVLPDAETLESTNGGFTATGEWQWGTPTFPGGPNRPIPFSGTKVWGTDLTGAYDNLTTSILTSPVYDLSGATELTLSFHHWMWIVGDDGGQLQVWDADQNKWVVVTPVGGYPDENITILIYGPGYNGIETSWRPAVFELDEFAGGPFQFRFYFKTNYTDIGIGWYVDDIALDTGNYPASVGENPNQTSRLLFAGPNPMTGACTIRLASDGAQAGTCEFFDVSGALVRRVEGVATGNGTFEFVWDGRDDHGNAVGNGVYLWRAAAGGEFHNGQVVRVR
ncbi:MAG: carboxypeptidase regulatory-like domain-containing protein [Candidatus Eisenbacteria bacterium]